jgi:SPP1 family phage portal protein
MKKNEITVLLETDFGSAVSKLKTQNTERIEKIPDYQREYNDNERESRESQIGKIQKDKMVPDTQSGQSKLVRVVKVPIAFAKKIVRTATAFEVGKAPTLIPSVNNNLSKLIQVIWKNNRLDYAIQKMIEVKKIETQSAIEFYIQSVEKMGFFKRILNSLRLTSQVNTIASKVLKNKDGAMYPYFDSSGNMIAFMWVYDYDSGSKKTTYYEVWDASKKYIYKLESSSYTFVSARPHGFDRIPIVYVSQDYPEWFEVKELIDRFEVSLSKLGSSNDYFAHPILATFGQVESMPGMHDSGKVINFPINYDESDPSKYNHGHAEFLTADSDNTSKKLELDTLYKLIHSVSSTPDLSFENVKGIGSLSTATVRLMFIEAIIKATANEVDNRTMIERMLNIIISGIVTTTNVALRPESEMLYYDVKFNSIIPADFKEMVDWVVQLKEKGMLSTESSLSMLDLVDVASELEKIKTEREQQPPANV